MPRICYRLATARHGTERHRTAQDDKAQGKTRTGRHCTVTAARSPEAACRWFDPEPFEVSQGTEGPSTAVQAYAAEVSFEEAIQGLTDPVVARTLIREDAQVSGRRAVRLEIRSTGVGPMPEGTMSYLYVIDLGARGVFVLETTTLAASDYATDKAIVDEAARTLQLF